MKDSRVWDEWVWAVEKGNFLPATSRGENIGCRRVNGKPILLLGCFEEVARRRGGKEGVAERGVEVYIVSKPLEA